MTPERRSSRRVYDYSSTGTRFAAWRNDLRLQTDLSSRVHRIRWERPAVLLFLAVLVLIFVFVLRGIHSGFPFFFFWTTPAVIIALVRKTWRRRAVPDVSVLLDLPAMVPQFPVAAKFEVDAQTYGWDEGVVSFVDGWLHFNGLRTEFSVSPWMVQPGLHTKTQGGQTFQKLLLHYTVDGVSFQTTLAPFDAVSGLANPFQGEFESHASPWLNDENHPTGPVILPPIRPMPAAIAQYHRLRQLLYFALSLCLGGLAVLGYRMFPNGLLGFIGLLLVAAVAVLITLLGATRTKMDAFLWLLERPVSDKEPDAIRRSEGSHRILQDRPPDKPAPARVNRAGS